MKWEVAQTPEGGVVSRAYEIHGGRQIEVRFDFDYRTLSADQLRCWEAAARSEIDHELKRLTGS